MKRNMKKLLVIALALMPSLSISVMAQSPGGGPSEPDPEVIPVKQVPTPTNPGPRIIPDEPIPIPITPAPNPNPNPNPAPRSSGYDLPYCYHQSGVVYIDADATVTYINASVTRYSDNQVWSDAAATNTLAITVSPDPGEYHLQLTLSTGQSYKGKYIIE